MITHQEPDAELTEEALVVLVVLLVIELDVVQGVVGGGQAHLTAPVHLKLSLFCVNLCLLQKAVWMWRVRLEKKRIEIKIDLSYPDITCIFNIIVCRIVIYINVKICFTT